MSLNRENVIWQSRDGTWNIGFYEFFEVNEGDENFDPEWDVEYEDYFNWASTGHASEEAASAAWKGANPGGSMIVAWSDKNAVECESLDKLAQRWKSEQRASSRPRY